MFWIGFRLYQTDKEPKSQQFAECRFESINGNVVRFYFYKEDTEDLKYKFGKLIRRRYKVYIVRALFDDKLPDNLTCFNNLKFLVKTNSFITRNETLVSNLLAEIYMGYLIDSLKHQNQT